MERFKKLRKIMWLLVAIFVINTALLIAAFSSYINLFVATILVVNCIVITYFTVLARGLIKENEEMERKEDERRERERKASKTTK